MKTDLAIVASRRWRAVHSWAAATHDRAAVCHEMAVKIHSEAVVFFRSHGQVERADREHGLVAAHLAAAFSERKLAASHWATAAQRERPTPVRLHDAAASTKAGAAPR
jgi:hypothetical protein